MKFGSVSKSLIHRIAESGYVTTHTPIHSATPSTPKKATTKRKVSHKVLAAIGKHALNLARHAKEIGTDAALRTASNVATHMATSAALDAAEASKRNRQHDIVHGHGAEPAPTRKVDHEHREMKKALKHPKDDDSDEKKDGEEKTHTPKIPKKKSHKVAARAALTREPDKKTQSVAATNSPKLKSDGNKRKKTTESVSESVADRVNSILS